MNNEEITQRLLAFMNSNRFMPMRKRTLARELEIDEADYSRFRRLLDTLVERGTIRELKKGKFGLPFSAGKRTGSGAAQDRGPLGGEWKKTPAADGSEDTEGTGEEAGSGGIVRGGVGRNAPGGDNAEPDADFTDEEGGEGGEEDGGERGAEPFEPRAQRERGRERGRPERAERGGRNERGGREERLERGGKPGKPGQPLSAPPGTKTRRIEV
jgi:hypothetical protein